MVWSSLERHGAMSGPCEKRATESAAQQRTGERNLRRRRYDSQLQQVSQLRGLPRNLLVDSGEITARGTRLRKFLRAPQRGGTQDKSEKDLKCVRMCAKLAMQLFVGVRQLDATSEQSIRDSIFAGRGCRINFGDI
jgi:hypothetical protein